MNLKLDPGAYAPTRGHSTDAGLDIKAPADYIIPAHSSVIIDTGVHVEIPSGCVGFLMSKSGLNVKYGITSEGVIDHGYTGSIIAKLYNNSDSKYLICKGDKITQLVVVECLFPDIKIVEKLDDNTERGDNGFGSTGR